MSNRRFLCEPVHYPLIMEVCQTWRSMVGTQISICWTRTRVSDVLYKYTKTLASCHIQCTSFTCNYMYMYMKNSNHETLKAIQHNTSATHPRQSFSKKNELPQVGLQPTTFCILIRCTLQTYIYALKIACRKYCM